MRNAERKRLNSNLLVGVIIIFILIVVILTFYILNKKDNPDFVCSVNQDCVNHYGVDYYCSDGNCLLLTDNPSINSPNLTGLFKNFFTRDYFVSAQEGNVIYYNNGWVGIGTSNPKQTLNVMGSFNVTGPALFPNSICLNGQVLSTTSTGQLNCLNMSNITGGNISGAGIINAIAFWNSSKTLSSTNALFWNSSTNSLGIGTDSPRATFMIKAAAPTAIGKGSVGAIAEIFDTSATGSNTVYGGLAFSSEPGYDYSVGKKTVNSNTFFQIRRQDGAEFVTIDQNGNFGIGTSNPTAKLQIDMSQTGNNPFTAEGLTLKNTAFDGRYAPAIYFKQSYWPTYLGRISPYAGYDWRFQASINSGGTWQDVARISTENSFISTGNFGIGTTTPTTKLEVKGIIKTTPQSSAPVCDSDSRGGIYYNSNDNKFYGCLGTNWVALH